MTVKTQLATAHGTHRVYYLAIDGLEPYLFQRSVKGTPTGWSRSMLTCLEPSHETTMGLDLGKMRTSLSQLTFKLDDIEDPDDPGTSYFGKLFSTGRWNNNPHVRLQQAANYGTYLDADATSFPIRSNVGLPSPSGGHIGQETINWASANADTLQTVTRGLHSAINVSQPWGHTYSRPTEGGKQYTYSVGTVPFSFVGRRVALRVTTWDPAAGAYRAESESELIWTGRVSDQIEQNGRSGVWSLSAESILKEIDREIPVNFPESYMKDINCMGPKGLSFNIFVHIASGKLVGRKTVTVLPDYYSPDALIKAIDQAQHNASWYHYFYSPGQWPSPVVRFFGSPGNSSKAIKKGRCGIFGAVAAGHTGGKIVIDPVVNGETCHPLGAIGFSSREKIYIDIGDDWDSSGTYAFGEESSDKYYTSYHPLHKDHNGSRLRVDEPFRFWADQGDDPGLSQAAVMIEDATLTPYWNPAVEEGSYYTRYNGRNSKTLELIGIGMNYSRDDYVGAKYGDKKAKVKQVYVPKYLQASNNKKGPFELLLTPLLSTGTQGYNGPYDRAPLELGLGIQAELVDTASFLNADKAIMQNFLAHRVMYPIVEPESYLELIAKEGQLFGYALVWRAGRLTVRPVLQPDTETWTTHLTDDNMVDIHEFPKITQSVKTVVNQYELAIHYSPTEGKFGGSYIVTDADSAIGVTETKQVKIKHAGIYLGNSKAKDIIGVLKTLLLGRFIRFPLPVLDRSLAPTLLNKIFVGDTVKVTSSRIQDPFGSGTRTTSCYAVVLDVKWNHKTTKGSCKLMLLDWPAAAAWAPAALVDVSAANGGFDTASNSLILVQHTWSTSGRKQDGQAVAEVAGWDVVVIERAPTDPTNPTVHGPFKALAYTPDNRALALNAAPVGWVNTSGHIVTFADYADCNADQYTDDKGTWQADPSSELLNATTKGQRYR